MKKKMKMILFLLLLNFLTGCGNSKQDIVEMLTKKIEKMNAYQIDGVLEVTNNETTYKYDIGVSYKKDEKYRVSLKNQVNNHEQIILKNNDGVYVLTPSLNKSFKFQSEWPYNNSQSYLYQTVLNDIKNDKNIKISEKQKEYVITTKVNYSNNTELTHQKIYVDKNANIKKIEVLNKNDIVKIKMTYKKVDYHPNFTKEYFEISENMKVTDNDLKTSGKLNDVVYPLYIPSNTYLETQDTMKTEDGERIILTFAGENPFTLIEETANIEDDYQIVPVYGDLEFINDTIGNITDTTASWVSDGIEYYAVSETLDKQELLQVVNSVNVIPVGK